MSSELPDRSSNGAFVSPSFPLTGSQDQYFSGTACLEQQYPSPLPPNHSFEGLYSSPDLAIDNSYPRFPSYSTAFPTVHNNSSPAFLYSFQDDTFSIQPTINIHASTPVNSHGPPRPLSRGRNDDFVGPLSPQSDVSGPSQRAARAQSQPEPPRLHQRQPSLDSVLQGAPITPPQQRPGERFHLRSGLQTPDLTHPTPPQRYYTPILPHPDQLHLIKHNRSEEDLNSPRPKRRKSMSVSPCVDLTDEDSLLLRLKDEGLPWKEIQIRFSEERGKPITESALQMRLNRLKKRMWVWTEDDIQALRMSIDYYENNKYEIIASKMTEFGATEKWNAKQCSKKWQEMPWTPDLNIASSHPMLRTPTCTTTYTSPIEPQPGPLGLYMFPITTSTCDEGYPTYSYVPSIERFDLAKHP